LVTETSIERCGNRRRAAGGAMDAIGSSEGDRLFGLRIEDGA
jgi:hypothetical protein